MVLYFTSIKHTSSSQVIFRVHMHFEPFFGCKKWSTLGVAVKGLSSYKGTVREAWATECTTIRNTEEAV